MDRCQPPELLHELRDGPELVGARHLQELEERTGETFLDAIFMALVNEAEGK